ncbi:MAG: NAD-dependent epimerase/dehydratase family protein [Bacteroidota bacterium]
MKVLVTGATGTFGRLIIKRLLVLGHQVIATSRNNQKAKELDFYNDVTYVQYDINSDQSINLFELFHRPDTVIHLAWDKLNDYKNMDHLNLILEKHKAFVFNLISNGLKDFNGIGTCYEYGLVEGELNENLPCEPILPYPQAKLALMEYIISLTNTYSFNFKWIRIFYVFGEIYERKNLYTQLMLAISNKEKVFNMSGGEQIRDFLSPLEIGNDIIKISTQNKVLGIINCCSGKPVKLKDFISDFLIKNNYSIDLNLGYYPYVDFEPMNTWGSIEKKLLCYS